MTLTDTILLFKTFEFRSAQFSHHFTLPYRAPRIHTISSTWMVDLYLLRVISTLPIRSSMAARGPSESRVDDDFGAPDGT